MPCSSAMTSQNLAPIWFPHLGSRKIIEATAIPVVAVVVVVVVVAVAVAVVVVVVAATFFLL